VNTRRTIGRAAYTRNFSGNLRDPFSHQIWTIQFNRTIDQTNLNLRPATAKAH